MNVCVEMFIFDWIPGDHNHAPISTRAAQMHENAILIKLGSNLNAAEGVDDVGDPLMVTLVLVDAVEVDPDVLSIFYISTLASTTQSMRT